MSAAALHLLLDAEREYVHPDLDYDYVWSVAGKMARSIRAGHPVECAYQPGDGTRYGIVIVPLDLLKRVQASGGGTAGSVRLASLIMEPAFSGWDYDGAHLVVIAEHGSAVVKLGHVYYYLVMDYLGYSHSACSAVSVALLLRAVAARIGELS